MSDTPGGRVWVVGLQGAMRSGKTSLADELVKHYGFTKYSMSTPLQRAVIAMGATEEETYGTLKNESNELWGYKTNRFAQQTLGTEWGRQMIDSDIWVNCLDRWFLNTLAEIDLETDQQLKIVIDNIRFPNEAAWVIENSGLLMTVRSERPGIEFPEWKREALRRLGWWSGALLGVHKSERMWPMAVTHRELWNSQDLGSFVELGAKIVCDWFLTPQIRAINNESLFKKRRARRWLT